jgi:hypothetical protein
MFIYSDAPAVDELAYPEEMNHQRDRFISDTYIRDIERVFSLRYSDDDFTKLHSPIMVLFNFAVMYGATSTVEHSFKCFSFFVNEQIHNALFATERNVDQDAYARLLMILLNIDPFVDCDMTEANVYGDMVHAGVTEITDFKRKDGSSIYNEQGQAVRNERVKANSRIIAIMKENKLIEERYNQEHRLCAKLNNKYHH